VRWGYSYLSAGKLHYGHGTDNPLDEAYMLVLHVLQLPYDFDKSFLESRLTSSEKKKICHLFERRVHERIPAAYLTHEAWFANLHFYVDERVLVPRSPIAELIESSFEPWVEYERVHRVLDMCTGSGCIAIACAYAFPEAEVDAVDVSSDALEVAKINIEKHGLEVQVNSIQSNLFENLQGKQYDLIVSNPPYVSTEEMQGLPDEYRHEPGLGLEAEDEGLEIVLRMLRDAPRHLSENGVMIVEVGNSEVALEERCPDVPFMWLDFERGGSGVFLLTREQLLEYQNSF
jgi:ribosomal protein L3 glutamine methyltransferase